MTDPSITRASIAYVVALAPCIFAIHSLRRSMQMKHKMLLGRHSSTFKVQGVHIQKFKSVIFSRQRGLLVIYILYKTHPQTRSLVIRFANLASFDLANAECRKESDVKLVHTVIAQWYGRALEKLLIRSFASFLRCRSLCELCARPAARRDAGANHGQRLCRRLRSSTGSSHSSHPRFPCFSRALPPLDLTSCP